MKLPDATCRREGKIAENMSGNVKNQMKNAIFAG